MPGPKPTEPDQDMDNINPEDHNHKLTAEEFKAFIDRKHAEDAAKAAQALAEREAAINAGTIPIDDMTGKELAEHHPGM